jgi:uncharacterized protein
VRVFYAADMHGSERVWRKFVNAGKFYGADALILGGDLTGKMLVPIIEEKLGRYSAQVFGRVERVKGPEGLEDLEKRLRFNGYYPLRCSPSECERLSADPEHRTTVMKGVMVDTVRRWVGIADEKLAGSGIVIYGIAGNDDAFEIDDVLNGESVRNVEGRVVRLGDYQLLSSAWSNPTPWDTPRELEDEALYEKLRELANRLEPVVPVILNLHIPPFDSGLDTGPAVGDIEDGTVRVKTSGGVPLEAPVGSLAVRRLIEEVKPVVSFHSHIHESRNAVKIGDSLCINPGSAYQDGTLCGAFVDLEGGRILRYQLVSG